MTGLAKEKSGYRPEIDGLRGIAILSVLFYHAELSFKGGLAGVDVFFVLSGYLITRILVPQVRSGTFSYSKFWGKRVRRLVPALFVVCLFTAFAGYFLLLPEDLYSLGGALISQPLLMANNYFSAVIEGGYFSSRPETYPLLHTWSLGIEEQFYLLFPLLLIACVPRSGHKQRPPIVVFGALAALSFGSAALLSVHSPVESFFLLPCRAWELLIGGSLVFLPTRKSSRRVHDVLGWVGLLAIAFSVLAFDKNKALPVTVMLIPVLGTAVVIWVNAPLSSSGRFLKVRPLVALGRLSYSLYLWHWPILAFASYFGLLESLKFKVLWIGLSLLLSYLSLRFIENPVRSMRVLSQKNAMLLLFIAYATATLFLGSVFRYFSGFPNNWSPLALLFLESRRISAALEIDDVNLDQPQNEPLFIGSDSTNAHTRFIVWGDSHARSLIPMFDKLGKENNLRGIQITRSATPALKDWDGLQTAQASLWWELLRRNARNHPDATIFLISKWSAANEENFEQQLKGTLLALTELGNPIVFVSEVPSQPTAPPRLAALATRYRFISLPFSSREDYEAQTSRARAIVSKHSQSSDLAFKTIEPGERILNWGTVLKDGQVLYADSQHLSRHGAIELEPLFLPYLREVDRIESTLGP